MNRLVTSIIDSIMPSGQFGFVTQMHRIDRNLDMHRVYRKTSKKSHPLEFAKVISGRSPSRKKSPPPLFMSLYAKVLFEKMPISKKSPLAFFQDSMSFFSRFIVCTYIVKDCQEKKLDKKNTWFIV